ncbi:MAG: aminoglycoside phosphotransferase family protein [Bacteroidota bacterium]
MSVSQEGFPTHLLTAYALPTSAYTLESVGSGHIHDSFRLSFPEAEQAPLFVQRINHRIFSPLPLLMGNLEKVLAHLSARMASQQGHGQLGLQLVYTRDRAAFFEDDEGNAWRLFPFLEGLSSFDLVLSGEQAFQGARSFGYFLAFLSELPPASIPEIIPAFHHVPSRLTLFEDQVSRPFEGRDQTCPAEIAFVRLHADRMCQFQHLQDQGVLPTRLTHNDTKFNNVLLDKKGIGRCVVDLDTVMPGLVHADFGDGIRTAASTAREDEADLALVGLDREKFQGFAEGYLSVVRDLLNPAELSLLGLSGAMMAYLIGLRFLTDYLGGDAYYKTTYPEHNLDRARNQFRLSQDILDQQDELNAYILPRKFYS